MNLPLRVWIKWTAEAIAAITLSIALFVAVLALTSCVPTPTPPPPTSTPVPTVTPTPAPPTWLLQCKVDKCPVMIATGVNDSGAPIITLNSGVHFDEGARIQFFYPCIEADGGNVYCEIYRDGNGNIYPAGRYIARSKLARVY
jgi:hypothetical protein